MTIFHQAENAIMKGFTYIHNVWKFCGDHISIKFFFGCIIDIQKNVKKEATRTFFLRSLQATECNFTFFFTNIIDVCVLGVSKAEDVQPSGEHC